MIVSRFIFPSRILVSLYILMYAYYSVTVFSFYTSALPILYSRVANKRVQMRLLI